jgi:hypothetical protein
MATLTVEQRKTTKITQYKNAPAIAKPIDITKELKKVMNMFNTAFIDLSSNFFI